MRILAEAQCFFASLHLSRLDPRDFDSILLDLLPLLIIIIKIKVITKMGQSLGFCSKQNVDKSNEVVTTEVKARREL